MLVDEREEEIKPLKRITDTEDFVTDEDMENLRNSWLEVLMALKSMPDIYGSLIAKF